MTTGNCKKGPMTLFRFGTCNVCMSVHARKQNLSSALWNMFNLDYAILGITETRLTHRKNFTVNDDGTKDLALNTGPAAVKYRSLWNLAIRYESEPGHTG